MRPTTETEREIVGICQAALDRAGERSALNYGAIQAVTRVDARTIVLSIVPDGSFFFPIEMRHPGPTGARQAQTAAPLGKPYAPSKTNARSCGVGGERKARARTR
jgi:hypothetical protein